MLTIRSRMVNGNSNVSVELKTKRERDGLASDELCVKIALIA